MAEVEQVRGGGGGGGWPGGRHGVGDRVRKAMAAHIGCVVPGGSGPFSGGDGQPFREPCDLPYRF